MADNLSLNCDVRELKLGASFSNNKASQYHTIKYDFKPASVDVNKMATVDVETTNQVTVTVPHLDGSGVPQTVFRGNQRPYTKECVLIIDRVTGEITLEKLSSNIQVKKTRQELASKPRPLTPVEMTNTTQRSSSRTKVTSGASRRINPVGGQPSTMMPRYPGAPQKTPPMLVRSPPRVRTSPPQATPWAGGGHSTLASLPMIGLDESPMQNGYAVPAVAATPVPAPSPAPPPVARPALLSLPPERSAPHPDRTVPLDRVAPSERCAPLLPSIPTHPGVPVEQSSSSSSSDSGSDSDSGNSGSDSEDDSRPRPGSHALSNGTSSGAPAALPSDVLNDDLCLSESGSDSD